MINSSPVYDAEDDSSVPFLLNKSLTNTVKLNEELSVASSEPHQLKYQVYRKQLVIPFSKIKGKSAAAKDFGISRASLYQKIKRYGITIKKQ